MRAAEEAGEALEPASLLCEKPGEGLLGIVAGRLVQITGRGKMPPGTWDLPASESGLECVILIAGEYAGMFRFHDAPRPESRPFIRHLGPRHNASKVILLSGDRETEVRYLANEIGISKAYYGKTPEEKVTLYVGDGINDAPAMMAATVAVALGQRSDVAAEASGAVILDADLTKVDALVHIGRRMRRIALQSAGGGMALSIAGMLIAAAGFLPPLAGAIGQEVIDVAAVLNALRVSFTSGDPTDIEPRTGVPNPKPGDHYAKF